MPWSGNGVGGWATSVGFSDGGLGRTDRSARAVGWSARMVVVGGGATRGAGKVGMISASVADEDEDTAMTTVAAGGGASGAGRTAGVWLGGGGAIPCNSNFFRSN